MAARRLPRSSGRPKSAARGGRTTSASVGGSRRGGAAPAPAEHEPSVFLEPAPPTPGALARALGGAAPRWRALEAGLAEDLGPLGEEWTFAGRKRGWSLRLKRGERAIVYFTPLRGRFRAAFALGEKAAAEALASALPAPVRAAVESARRYVEGRAVVLEVRTAADARSVRALAAIKARN